MNLYPYPDGMDCGWVGVDAAGQVGIFFTAGVGPIPIQFLDAAAGVDVQPLALALPPLGVASQLVLLGEDHHFTELATRGLYVFDWRDARRAPEQASGLYEPALLPNHPLQAATLGEPLRALAASCRFEGAVFAAGEPLDVQARWRCRLPSEWALRA